MSTIIRVGGSGTFNYETGSINYNDNPGTSVSVTLSRKPRLFVLCSSMKYPPGTGYYRVVHIYDVKNNIVTTFDNSGSSNDSKWSSGGYNVNAIGNVTGNTVTLTPTGTSCEFRAGFPFYWYCLEE